MAAMGVDKRQWKEAMVEDKFPEGLRVLSVDDDCVCLKALEAALRLCKYHPTTVMDAKTALKMLRAGKDQYDLVITELHVPDMDGFKLLELIRLEMDLPVIMLSVDCDKKVVMKGINHGACDYLVKPVRTNELKTIWQHVERRRWPEAIIHISRDDDDDGQSMQPGSVAKRKDSANNGKDGDYSNENKESTQIATTHKKPRLAWTLELHTKFVEAINKIGLHRATPKKILEMMNVDYLTRHNIASHLQKYMLYLRKVNANQSGGASERWHLPYTTNNQWSFMYSNEHERWSVSLGGIASWSENNYDAEGHLTQPTNIQTNLCMGTLVHGGSMSSYVMPQPSDARRFNGSIDPTVRQFSNILNKRMSSDFPSYDSCNSYAELMCDKLMEISKGKTPSNLRSSFTNTPSGGGWSLVPSQVKIGRINQLESYATSSSELYLNDQMNGVNALLMDDNLANMHNEDFIREDATMD